MLSGRVSEYAAEASAMMFCLSKGLGAPIGSILVGEAEFIREARGVKILFGGGWRHALGCLRRNDGVEIERRGHQATARGRDDSARRTSSRIVSQIVRS